MRWSVVHSTLFDSSNHLKTIIMKKFYLLTAFLSVFANAQFSKVMDFTAPLNPGEYQYANKYNTWNNKLFYVVQLGDGTFNINVTDGTSAGTVTIANVPKPTDIASGVFPALGGFKAAGNGMYIKFFYIDGVTYQQNDELWFSDGTAANTRKLLTNARININGLTGVSSIQNYQRPYQEAHIGDTFYFWKGADNVYATDLYLWKSDGTAAGTMQVSSAVKISNDTTFPDEIFDTGLVYNGNYYFIGQEATDNSVRNKFYKLENGTPQLLATFNRTERMGTVFKNKIYFIARQSFGSGSGYFEREIWQSDGTAAGTVVFKNFQGNNSGDGVDLIDHFTFHKTANYMFIRTNDNLLNNVVVTDGNPNNITTIYSASTYPVTHFYCDEKMAYFLKQSTDTNVYTSFSVRMSDLLKTNITKAFYNTNFGTVVNGTLWIPNKPAYNSWVYTPWRSTGTDDTTINTSGYNYTSKLFTLNNNIFGFSSYLGSINLALYRFDANFVFNNISGNNQWNTNNNWQTNFPPSIFDNATIPPLFSPQINTDVEVSNLTLSSPLNISAGSLSINGNLNLNEKITLNGNNLNLKGSSSQIINGSATNYIVTNGIGAVKVENLDAARGTVNLPIGTATNYNPVLIANSGTSDTFSAKVSDGISNTTNGAVNTTWDISETTAGGSNANLTLGWSASQQNGSFSLANAKIGHFYNGQWNEEISEAVSGADPYTITGTGITSFSPFAVMNFATLSTTDFAKSEILVYPNPFTESLNVELKENAVISIYDMSGKQVSVNFLTKGKNQLNKGNLSSGVYVYQIKNTKGEVVSSGKVIKK